MKLITAIIKPCKLGEVRGKNMRSALMQVFAGS